MGLWAGDLSSPSCGLLHGSCLPKRAESQRGKGRRHNVFCGFSMDVTCPHSCHILLIMQINPDSVWEGTAQRRLGRWDHRATWKLAATVFPSHSPLPSLPTTLTYPESLPQSPAAGDAQEVTYAQLDQRALTLRAAQAVPLQSPEPAADSSMYAALARR